MDEHKHVTATAFGRINARTKTRRANLAAMLLACLMAIGAGGVFLSASAQAQNSETGAAEALRTGSVTGLPLPRFVSLKADRVNMRRGPDRSHQVEWVLLRAGLPVEITEEYENWRRIRDYAGDEGWVFHTLLSGRRTVLFSPWEADIGLTPLRRQPNASAPVVAQVGQRVLGDIVACKNRWCQIDVGDVRGWVEQDILWGVYPGETVK